MPLTTALCRTNGYSGWESWEIGMVSPEIGMVSPEIIWTPLPAFTTAGLRSSGTL
jgi:hypothetical protein